MTIEQSRVTQDEAVKIATEFGQQIGLAPFHLSSIKERTDDTIAEWIVYFDFDKIDGFEDDCNFAIVVVNKTTGIAKLLETL